MLDAKFVLSHKSCETDKFITCEKDEKYDKINAVIGMIKTKIVGAYSRIYKCH